MTRFHTTARTAAHTTASTLVGALALALLLPSLAGAAGRERAIEQIPELMGRILESQEEIRTRESEMAPLVQRYGVRLDESKRAIDAASSETEAAAALVDYVEAYSARLEAQADALRAIRSPLVRMRADARELVSVAAAARPHDETPAEREVFFQDQFQGVAAATGELADRLERAPEAATAGAVLHASWASHSTLELPLAEMGPDGAIAFARQVEGLYARWWARTNQIEAERRSVRRLLDVLIERQLAQRLDSLFTGSDSLGVGALLAGNANSADWQELGGVVSRTLGLPAMGAADARRTSASMEQLDYFARGNHRER